jgi:hypothetical protein
MIAGESHCGEGLIDCCADWRSMICSIIIDPFIRLYACVVTICECFLIVILISGPYLVTDVLKLVL